MFKPLWREAESEAVETRVAAEDVVVVSSLIALETEVQLAGAWLAGRYGQSRWRRFRGKLAEFRATDPFRFQPLPGTVFDTSTHALAGRIAEPSTGSTSRP